MKSVTFQSITIPAGLRKPLEAPDELSEILPGVSTELLIDRQVDALILPEQAAELPSARRLVVIVPEGSIDESELARRVWELASAAGLPVLYLGLSPDPTGTPTLRRRLALLAAETSQTPIAARPVVEVGKDWRQAASAHLQNGDLLVCLAEQHVPFHLLGQKRLGESLAAELQAPVILLAGLHVGRSASQLDRVRDALAWLFSLVILAAFGALQAWISQKTEPHLSTIFLCLSVVLEIIILLRMNAWIG